LPGTRRSPLGRETAIQELERTAAGWFRLVQGGQLPALEADLPARERGQGLPGGEARDGEGDTFDHPVLPAQYQWLRSSRPGELFSLEDRPGHLRLFGRESLGSLYHQALVARRQQHFSYLAETELRFEPEHFQQMAGLVCYYNSSKFHYLYISRDEELGKHLAVMSCAGELSLNAHFPNYGDRVPVPENRPLFLRARVDRHNLACFWSVDGDKWLELPLALDASVLCDEAGKGEGAHFTGAFVGMCCQDLAGTRLPADFARFSYRGLDLQP
jgi:xylan 1,4-beta-xylosidase